MKKDLGIVMALILMGVSVLWAAQPKAPLSGTWKFEVVDVQCFATEGHHGGDWHKDNCALKGKELALLDLKTQQMFHPIDADFMPMRETLKEKCGQSIKVTGKIYYTKGVNYVQVEEMK